MASSPLQNHPPQVRDRASKPHACLVKIITIISTVHPLRPHQIPPNLETNAFGLASLGFGVDLRLRIGPPPEIGRESTESDAVDVSAPMESGDASAVEEITVPTVENTISPAESVVGDVLTAKSSEGECDPEEVRAEIQTGVEEEVEAVSKEYSEITNISRKRNREEEEEEEEEEEALKEQEEVVEEAEGGGEEVTNKGGNGSEGCLGLLLEAIRHVSGGYFDDEETGEEERVEPSPSPSPSPPPAPPPPSGKRRSGASTWLTQFGLYEDSAPVVRSKRGRNQTLPYRYRDSVIEPWRKQPTGIRSGRVTKPGTPR